IMCIGGGEHVEGFRIDTSDEKISSVSRTIRIKAETFDKINEINMKTGVSFNKSSTNALNTH
ncbi:MAG: hypothetical protein V8S87_07700, partial [Oscillospiraceae bacterium]